MKISAFTLKIYYNKYIIKIGGVADLINILVIC